MLAPGRLLVATPVLADGPFRRAVVQLLQHEQGDGAFGVVLNAPTDTPLASVLPGWALLAPEPVVVFEGGPVQQTIAVCLGRLTPGSEPDPTYVPVPQAPWLGTVDLDSDLVGEAVEQVRVFAGYAGWAAGQLEDEVDQGAWWVLEALPGDPFSSSPELLWRQVLARQGMPLALAAGYPDDPKLN